MQRILITGASGFVGPYLRRALIATWPDAVIRGLGAAGDIGSDPWLTSVDLLDPAAMMAIVRESKPDVVIHLAAQASVALGDAGAADTTWSVNLTGSLHLALAIAAHAPDATLLFVSTSEVYGASFLGGPVHEGSATLPMNVYAKSKLLAERMFAAVLSARTRLVVARPFNHTGPGQRETFVLPSFAAQVARIEVGLQPPRIIVGNLDVRRDFLDVRDVVAAYVALLAAAPRLPRRFTCNIASGTTHLLGDLVETLRRHAQCPFDIEIDPARLRSADLPVACGDPALLHATTGWVPSIRLDATIDALLQAARATVGES